MAILYFVSAIYLIRPMAFALQLGLQLKFVFYAHRLFVVTFLRRWRILLVIGRGFPFS